MNVQSLRLVTTGNVWTLANLKNVVSMLNAASEITVPAASVGRATRATHMSFVANMNASLTQSVLTTWPAEMKNVLIPVKTAQLMQTAQQEIIELFVNAKSVTLETLMDQFVAKVSPTFKLFTSIIQEFVIYATFSSSVPIPKVECTTDRDCPSRESCLDEKCKNPCQAIDPCTSNAECTVHNTLPLRTMSCTCLPGFTGKGDERCDKICK